MTKKLEELFNLEESTTVEPAIPVIEESKEEVRDLERSYREVDTIEVEGRVNAYQIARWLAFKLDRRTHMNYGVEWAVRRGTTI